MANPLALTNIRVPRNGYCFIYLINESGVDVFFDNLRVRHDRGRILEENHYYPFGLRIDGLSSRAYDGPANRYGYQGDYAEYDDDLGWNDFMLRSYDPQLGRWLQNDPFDQFASGYVGMGADPANNVDPTGGVVPGISETGLADVVVSAARRTTTAIAPFSTVASISGNIAGAFGLAGRGIALGGKVQGNPWRPLTQEVLNDNFQRFAKERNNLNLGGPVSIGNYVEDAVIRSLGVEKNEQRLPGYDGGSFIPDIIEQSGTTEFEVRSPFPFPQQRRGAVFDDAQITEFDQGHFGDVKTGSIVKNSRNQINRMIQYLADKRGGYTYHNYQGGGGRSVKKNIRARDYGAAILTLITPADTDIDPAILEFAEKRGVVIFQRTLEYNLNTGQMRVKAGRTQRTMLHTRYKYVQPSASDPVFIQLPK